MGMFITPNISASPMATSASIPPVTIVFTMMYGPLSMPAISAIMIDRVTVIPPAVFIQEKAALIFDSAITKSPPSLFLYSQKNFSHMGVIRKIGT